jgi:magnesium-transporting ATPase (P-type)
MFIGVIALEERPKSYDDPRTLRLISSDDLAVCRKIAEKSGVITHAVADTEQHADIMTSAQFRELIGGVYTIQNDHGEPILYPNNQSAFNQITDSLRVLAQAQPSDKLLFTVGLQNKGAKVALFSEDSIALKQADVAYTTKLDCGFQMLEKSSDTLSQVKMTRQWGACFY